MIEKSNNTCFIQNKNVTLHAKACEDACARQMKQVPLLLLNRILAAENELVMEVQTVKISNEKLIPSGAIREGISVRRSGIAKVLWRKLNVNVPASKVIAGGVDIYKD